jgi:hypothetical protein
MTFLELLTQAEVRLGLCETSVIREKRSFSPFVGDKSKEGQPAREAQKAKEAPAWRPTYAHPWPDELPGLGPRRIGPFDPCGDCGRGSWVRFGYHTLCLPCATRRARSGV